MKRLDEPQRRIYIQYLENHVRPKRLKHSLALRKRLWNWLKNMAQTP